jgi:hypothetical protein
MLYALKFAVIVLPSYLLIKPMFLFRISKSGGVSRSHQDLENTRRIMQNEEHYNVTFN